MHKIFIVQAPGFRQKKRLRRCFK